MSQIVVVCVGALVPQPLHSHLAAADSINARLLHILCCKVAVVPALGEALGVG